MRSILIGTGIARPKGPLNERVCTSACQEFEHREWDKVRKTGETARVGAGKPALHPRAREGQCPLARVCNDAKRHPNSGDATRRRLNQNAAGERAVIATRACNDRGHRDDCSRETGQQGTRTRDSDSDAGMQ